MDEKDIIEMLERLAEEYPDGFSVDVLGVINSQKTEIQRVRTETIKEFAERLRIKLQCDCEYSNKFVFNHDIDDLVKEMDVQE